MLLVGAGLLLMSFYRLQRVDAGYRGDRVMSAEIFGNFTKYPDPQSLRRLYVSVLERLESSPGVVSAAVTNGVPLAGLQPGQTRFQIRGKTYDTPESRPTADVRVSSPKYFDTLGIPMRRGRGFTELDHEDAASVVIINETLASREFEGRDPIGMEVSANNGQNWSTIVGIVGDVKTFGLDRDSVSQAYLPLRQSGGLAGRVLVRMTGDPSGATAVIREAVHGIDPDLPIENVRTLDEIRDTALATPQADRDAAHRVRGARAPGHADWYHRRDCAIGVATHAGIRVAHGARRESEQRADNGRAPRPLAGRHRIGRRHCRGVRPRACVGELPVSDPPRRPADIRRGRRCLRDRGHARVPWSRVARDDGGSDAGVER